MSAELAGAAGETRAFILSGGLSSRMGRGHDKARLPFGGFGSAVEFQFRRLESYGLFSRVMISQKTSDLPFDAPIILDESGIFAPITAIAGILRAIDGGRERAFIIAVDTPFFDKRAIETLLKIDSPAVSAAIARTPSGAHPLCAVYRKNALPYLENAIALGELSIKRALKDAVISYADFDEEKLFNFNDPIAYEIANKILNSQPLLHS